MFEGSHFSSSGRNKTEVVICKPNFAGFMTKAAKSDELPTKCMAEKVHLSVQLESSTARDFPYAQSIVIAEDKVWVIRALRWPIERRRSFHFECSMRTNVIEFMTPSIELFLLLEVR